MNRPTARHGKFWVSFIVHDAQAGTELVYFYQAYLAVTQGHWLDGPVAPCQSPCQELPARLLRACWLGQGQACQQVVKKAAGLTFQTHGLAGAQMLCPPEKLHAGLPAWAAGWGLGRHTPCRTVQTAFF